MLTISPLGLPVVLAHIISIYGIFRGKIRLGIVSC